MNVFQRKSSTALKLFLICLFICCIALIVWLRFLFTPLITNDEGYQYTVPSGASFLFIIDDLYFKNIIKNKLLFILLVKSHVHPHDLKAGEYLFPKGTTPVSLLDQMTTGGGLVYHQFMIVPGWNMRQLRAALLQNTHLRHRLPNISDAHLMQYLGHSELVSPEGQFFPDTYYFSNGTIDTVLLKQALKAMQDKINTIWQARSPDLPLKNSNELVIVASIIEKETELDMERPIIAGVLINRLKKNMLLQFDPTVIYGLGLRFTGKIYRENLLEDTPYNTYVHKGLPPTAISMPSLASLLAAAHPQQHDYYYFVARGDDPSHEFSKTLAEHYRAVASAAAKKIHPRFFNRQLLQSHLLKLFSDQIPQLPLMMDPNDAH
jgi:UPF0755 protein